MPNTLYFLELRKPLLCSWLPKAFLDSKRQPLTIVMGPGHVGEIPWASFIIRLRFVSQRCVCSLPPSPGAALHIIKAVLRQTRGTSSLPPVIISRLLYTKPSFAAFFPPCCCWHQEYTSCLLSGRICA